MWTPVVAMASYVAILGAGALESVFVLVTVIEEQI